MKLPRMEWELLDNLIRRVGFGGYYDLIECLRDVGRRMNPRLEGSKCWSDEDDLRTIVQLLLRVEIEVKRQEEV